MNQWQKQTELWATNITYQKGRELQTTKVIYKKNYIQLKGQTKTNILDNMKSKDKTLKNYRKQRLMYITLDNSTKTDISDNKDITNNKEKCFTQQIQQF